MEKPLAQIFVSYAHLDNMKPQGFEIGWVDRLYDALNIEVPMHGVEVKLWRDKRDLEPERYFNKDILDNVSRSDAFIAIVSPAYPQRPFCLKELIHFLDESKVAPVNERCSRVLKVVKRPIVDPRISGMLPEKINDTGEFPFYSVDRQTGRVLLFIRPNGDIASEEFWDAMEQLAEAIARTVRRLEPHRQKSQSDLSIYLAEPSQDQKQSYRTIRSELVNQGFQVLPDPEQTIPGEYDDALAFIDQQLSRCVISVHLLGKRPGYIPSDRAGQPTKPITRLQLERARARGSVDPSFRRFIWASRSIEPSQKDQKALFAEFKKGIALLENDEFVTEPLQLFKDAVLDHLSRRGLRRPVGKTTEPCPILLITHPSDRSAVGSINAALYDAKFETFLLTLDEVGPHDEKRIVRLVPQVEAVIVLFAIADETWAKTVLAMLNRIAASDDKRRPVRAVLFRSESGHAAEGFRSHYSDLVLTWNSVSWDSSIDALRARLARTIVT
jgi:hypothetical protein